jgi:hypothetical protein
MSLWIYTEATVNMSAPLGQIMLSPSQYEACDQISDSCHQQLLRKMQQKISWTDGRMEGRTEVKQYWSFVVDHIIPPF